MNMACNENKSSLPEFSTYNRKLLFSSALLQDAIITLGEIANH